MKKFAHFNASTIEEAVELLRRYGGRANLIAGGTDLLGKMKDRILPNYPEALVNLKTIPGLDFIKEEKGLLKIGALTRLEDIATSETVKEKYSALAEAAHRTASPHLRGDGDHRRKPMPGHPLLVLPESRKPFSLPQERRGEVLRPCRGYEIPLHLRWQC